MRFLKRPYFVWLIILVALPWPIDYWYRTAEDRQRARDHELFRRYDCGYTKTPCPAADFDGDGLPSEFRIVHQGKPGHEFLSVADGGREILRIPHVIIDDTLRTHMAVSFDSGSPRLLIYDGVARRPPLKAAYAFGGGTQALSEASPTRLEEEILRAMAAYDNTGAFNERAFADILRLLRFMAYYTLLIVLTCVLWWQGSGWAVPSRHARPRPPGGAK